MIKFISKMLRTPVFLYGLGVKHNFKTKQYDSKNRN